MTDENAPSDKKEGAAEAIENNIRRKMVEKVAVNPKYYEKMSAILDELIQKRKQGVISYKELLEEQIKLAKNVEYPEQNEVINEAISLMKGTKLNAYSYSNTEKEEIWRNINNKITKRSTIKRWSYAASIAACFMIILLGSLWKF